LLTELIVSINRVNDEGLDVITRSNSIKFKNDSESEEKQIELEPEVPTSASLGNPVVNTANTEEGYSDSDEHQLELRAKLNLYTDQYIAFLKQISLNLNNQSKDFFFNKYDKTKCFPLYQQAIKFYDHPDNLVRTSIRTITLQIYAVYGND
jgi:hypothetical protein